MKSTDKTLDATIGTLTGNEARAIIRAALGLRRSVPINKAKNDVIRALQDGQRCGITKRSIAATRRTDTKRSAAGRKAIQTMRRNAGDAYLSGLGKKAAATKRRKRKPKRTQDSKAKVQVIVQPETAQPASPIEIDVEIEDSARLIA